LITTDGGLVSIETDPNDVIVDNIPFILLSMLHFKLSCCRHPSSDKAIMYFSSFFTSSSIALLPRKVIKYNIDNVIKNREQNLSEIRQQRQIFHDQVKQMRVKINSHLDTLEQNFIKELDDAEDKIKSKIENLLKQLSEESKTMQSKFNIID
jgi:predicted DNA-binding protein (UPF0278 family)